MPLLSFYGPLFYGCEITQGDPLGSRFHSASWDKEGSLALRGWSYSVAPAEEVG